MEGMLREGGRTTSGAAGLRGHPRTLQPHNSPGSVAPLLETHHNLSCAGWGVFKPDSEAVTKCHLQ